MNHCVKNELPKGLANLIKRAKQKFVGRRNVRRQLAPMNPKRKEVKKNGAQQASDWTSISFSFDSRSELRAGQKRHDIGL
jgi:hypothetical protein